MILYSTRETIERYKLKMPEALSSPMKDVAMAVLQKEAGDRLLEWGCKLMYFDRRKCLQVVNFASKLTLFLIDVKMDALPYVGDAIATYLFEIYKNDSTMDKLLKRFFESAPFCCFSKLQDKSIIATLNCTQWQWAEDGNQFYEYISNGILNSKQINTDINRNWIFTQKINGKTEYFNSAEKFEKLLKDRFDE